MRADISELIGERTGHFALESGHHGRRWLDLELLFRSPAAVRPLADELAAKIAPYRPEVICGPLVEGAFVALCVAETLGIELVYAQRIADPSSSELFSVHYELPAPQRQVARNRRVAIVNDVINAGSAVRGALANLAEIPATPVVLGALLILGEAAEHLARDAGAPLETLAADSAEIWTPARCPLCATGAPLTPHPGF